MRRSRSEPNIFRFRKIIEEQILQEQDVHLLPSLNPYYLQVHGNLGTLLFAY
jgi:hypothetical protein